MGRDRIRSEGHGRGQQGSREGLSDLAIRYRSLNNDDLKRGFLDAAIESVKDQSDGVFVGLMQEILGDDWVDELARLGLTNDAD